MAAAQGCERTAPGGCCYCLVPLFFCRACCLRPHILLVWLLLTFLSCDGRLYNAQPGLHLRDRASPSAALSSLTSLQKAASNAPVSLPVQNAPDTALRVSHPLSRDLPSHRAWLVWVLRLPLPPCSPLSQAEGEAAHLPHHSVPSTASVLSMSRVKPPEKGQAKRAGKEPSRELRTEQGETHSQPLTPTASHSHIRSCPPGIYNLAKIELTNKEINILNAGVKCAVNKPTKKFSVYIDVHKYIGKI